MPPFQSPKIMTIVDLTKFMTFIAAFEEFFAGMLDQVQTDPSLLTFVARARSSSVAFEGGLDASLGASSPSALDIGSFLMKMEEICAPVGSLQTSLANARAAYADMIVAHGIAPGTARGTGMHIVWPVQVDYVSNDVWQAVLFNNFNYVTTIIPNFRAFLQHFFSVGPQVAQVGDGSSSVCTQGATPTTADCNPHGLIHCNSGEENEQQQYVVTATISSDVSGVIVYYGIDLTTPLKPYLTGEGFEPRDDDYLFLKAGDVSVTFDTGSSITSTWDMNFYFLDVSGNRTKFEPVYVIDQGSGSKGIPAMFFAEDQTEGLAQLQLLDFLFYDSALWVEKGGVPAILQFYTEEADGRVIANENLTLFTYTAFADGTGAYSERPRSSTGYFVPLMLVDAFIQGRKLDEIAGGFNQTVIAWNEDVDYNILTTPVDNVFNRVPDTDAVVVSMNAFNISDPAGPRETIHYDVVRRGGVPFNLTVQGETGDESEGAGPASDLPDEASRAGEGHSAGRRFIAGLAFLVALSLLDYL
jgi:hypothetical protein